MRCTASACELAAILEIGALRPLACGALLLPVSSRTDIACLCGCCLDNVTRAAMHMLCRSAMPSCSSRLALPRLAAAGTVRATRHAGQYQQEQRELVLFTAPPAGYAGAAAACCLHQPAACTI